ncbi:MAG: GNAT family N-acetyltransferase [Candidatus Bathyarchaeia archaeon]
MVVVRKATLDDLDVIKALADSHRYELGFVRCAALQRAIEQNEVFVAQNRQYITGFVDYHHRRDGQTTLYHIGVSPALRGQGIGRSLVMALYEEAQQRGSRTIVLKCPADLPANDFYAALSFHLIGEERSKNRPLRIWSLSL